MVAVIPEVPCHFAERGCTEKVPVTQLRQHMKECQFHPSRTCRRLERSEKGEDGYERFIKPAMARAGVLEYAEQLEEPLCCDEALLPGFVDEIAEGYAYDLAESVCPEDDWYPFRAALLEAQAKAYSEGELVRREYRMRAASRLCASLFVSLTGTAEDKEEAAYAALDSLSDQLQMASALSRVETPQVAPTQSTPTPALAPSRGCAWLDIPEEGCLAVEAACVIEGRERTAELLLEVPDDPCLPLAKREEVAKVLMRVNIPGKARLVPLHPRPLPPASIAVFQRKYKKLKLADQESGQDQAARILRIQMRDYPWVTRMRVEKLIADLERREYSFPKRPEPSYWTAGFTLPSHVYSLVKVTDQDLWRFQAVFDISLVKRTSFDRVGEVADRLIVESVERVENGKAWSEYVRRRDTIASERCQAGDDVVPDLPNVKVKSKILPGQRMFEDPGVLGRVQAQEVYLFHGTSLRGARSIAKQEFNTEFSRDDGLFGPGLYFAESATKSDEYCEEDPNDNFCTILICRVCLGDHLLVADEEVDAREIMRTLLAKGRHSVLGDREAARGTFREFITYDGTACYPEYIVRYRRAYGDEHSSARELAIDDYRDIIAREEAWEAMELEAMQAVKKRADADMAPKSDCLCRCQ